MIYDLFGLFSCDSSVKHMWQLSSHQHYSFYWIRKNSKPKDLGFRPSTFWLLLLSCIPTFSKDYILHTGLPVFNAFENLLNLWVTLWWCFFSFAYDVSWFVRETSFPVSFWSHWCIVSPFLLLTFNDLKRKKFLKTCCFWKNCAQ